MAELIRELNNSSIFISAGFFVSALICLFLVVRPIVKELLAKVKQAKSVHGPGGVKIDLISPSGERTKISSKIVDDRMYEQILEAVEGISNAYASSTMEAKDLAYEEYSKRRERCVRNAVGSIRLLYEEDGHGDVNGEFLDLFLEVELGNVLRRELIDVFKNPSLKTFTEVDESQELKKVIDSCVESMKVAVIDYAYITDKDTMREAIQKVNLRIKDEVYNAIKTFVKLSKDEQVSIIKAGEARCTSMERKISLILGSKSTEKETE